MYNDSTGLVINNEIVLEQNKLRYSKQLYGWGVYVFLIISLNFFLYQEAWLVT